MNMKSKLTKVSFVLTVLCLLYGLTLLFVFKMNLGKFLVFFLPISLIAALLRSLVKARINQDNH